MHTTFKALYKRQAKYDFSNTVVFQIKNIRLQINVHCNHRYKRQQVQIADLGNARGLQNM